jgi:peroxiredoxin Q/BCP
VADQFGVKRSVSILGKNKRATFVIGTDQRVLAVIRSELAFNSHADRALEVLRERAAAT